MKRYSKYQSNRRQNLMTIMLQEILTLTSISLSATSYFRETSSTICLVMYDIPMKLATNAVKLSDPPLPAHLSATTMLATIGYGCFMKPSSTSRHELTFWSRVPPANIRSVKIKTLNKALISAVNSKYCSEEKFLQNWRNMLLTFYVSFNCFNHSDRKKI